MYLLTVISRKLNSDYWGYANDRYDSQEHTWMIFTQGIEHTELNPHGIEPARDITHGIEPTELNLWIEPTKLNLQD